jgi:hypothetical protein
MIRQKLHTPVSATGVETLTAAIRPYRHRLDTA